MPPKKKIKALPAIASPTPFRPALVLPVVSKVVPLSSAGSNQMRQNQHYQNQSHTNGYNYGYSGVAPSPHDYPYNNQYTNDGYGQQYYNPMRMQMEGYNYWYDHQQQTVPSLTPPPPPPPPPPSPSLAGRGAFTPVNAITPKLLRKVDGAVDELLSDDMFLSYTDIGKNGSLKGEAIVVTRNKSRKNLNFVTKEDVTGQGGRWMTRITKNTTILVIVVPRFKDDDSKIIIKAKKLNAENDGNGNIKFCTSDLFFAFLASQPAQVEKSMLQQRLQLFTTEANSTILQKQSVLMKQQMYQTAMAFTPTFAPTNSFVLQAAGSHNGPQMNAKVNSILSIKSSPVVSSQDNRNDSCRRDLVAKVVATATATQKNMKTVCTTTDVVGDTNNIGNDNRIPLQLILSFILAPQKKGKYRHMDRRLSKEIAQGCSKLPCVNKRFHAIVLGIMNGQVVETTDIKGKCNNAAIFSVLLSPNKLAKIKSTAMQLDLQSIQPKFIYDANETWGEDKFELVAEYFTGSIDRFVKNIEKEYRYFLVVKCVETLIRNHYGSEIIDSNGTNNKSNGDTSATNLNFINGWIEKCNASTIVDKYWHSHMLSPKLYQKHCKMLVGEIIDHEAMYFSPNQFDGSDYKGKKNFLFQFEEEAFDMSHDSNSFILRSDVDITETAATIAEEMEDDYGCG